MILSPARALKQITTGKIATGYLLLGRELYWRDRIWNALRGALDLNVGSTALVELDLRQISLDAIFAQATERNLWSSRQMILIRSAHLASGAKPLASLGEYFRDPNPDAVLVFEMTDVDLDMKDWREREKVKSRQEQWGNICEVVLLGLPSEEEALELVQREASRRGCHLSREATGHLVSLMNRDMGRVVKELDKLCLFRAGEEQISTEDVELLAGSGAPSQGISLPEAIGSGSPATLLQAFLDQIPKGAYLPLILADVTRYLRQLLLLQQRHVRDSREASKLLWSVRLPASQPLLPELLRQSRAFSSNHLVRCLQEALRAEVALRSSPADDRLILERLLLEIARPLRSRRVDSRREADAPLPRGSRSSPR